MKSELQNLAELAIVDMKLDELQEDCGDLPLTIKRIEKLYYDHIATVKETEQILSDLRKFKAESKITLQTLKDREAVLADKQFNVKNNKEFDAITKEIDHAKSEFVRLTDELRGVGVKEENLVQMLETQNKDVENSKNELDEAQKELEMITSDQNEDLLLLRNKRKEITKNVSQHWYAEYLRIRTLHHDAVVPVKKNSCSGCYSTIPPQKNVELRNNEDKIYYCENCGRIIYTQELEIDPEVLNVI